MKKSVVCSVLLSVCPPPVMASPCGSGDIPAVVSAFESAAIVKTEAEKRISRGLVPGCVRTISLGQTCAENCGTKFLVIQRFEPKRSDQKFNAENVLAFTVQGPDGKVFAVLPVNLLLKDDGAKHTILE